MDATDRRALREQQTIRNDIESGKRCRVCGTLKRDNKCPVRVSDPKWHAETARIQRG